MKKVLFALVILPYFLFAQKTEKTDYTKFVNPFVGTKNMGHTFPGATVPFGMVQLSPDNGVSGWLILL